QPFGRASETVERESISYSAVNLGGGAIIGFFGDAVSLCGILIEKEGKAGVVRGGGRFRGGTFVKTLHRTIQIWKIIVCPVNTPERVQCFTAHRVVLCNPQQKLLGFDQQIPLGGEPRQVEFALRFVVSCFFSRAPQRVELG